MEGMFGWNYGLLKTFKNFFEILMILIRLYVYTDWKCFVEWYACLQYY